jgi:hypothetical protein
MLSTDTVYWRRRSFLPGKFSSGRQRASHLYKDNVMYCLVLPEVLFFFYFRESWTWCTLPICNFNDTHKHFLRIDVSLFDDNTGVHANSSCLLVFLIGGGLVLVRKFMLLDTKTVNFFTLTVFIEISNT